jgi:transcriptional regulator with XRE-family HTH domain
VAKASNSGGMSPLARMLQRKNAEGLTYTAMARKAYQAQMELSVSRISQIANDQTANRLPPDTVKALAFVLDERPEVIAELDDERFGLARRHVAHDRPSDPLDLSDVATDRLLDEIARRAGGDPKGRR